MERPVSQTPVVSLDDPFVGVIPTLNLKQLVDMGLQLLLKELKRESALNPEDEKKATLSATFMVKKLRIGNTIQG